MSDVVRPMTAEEYFDLPETNRIDELIASLYPKDIAGEYIVSPLLSGLN